MRHLVRAAAVAALVALTGLLVTVPASAQEPAPPPGAPAWGPCPPDVVATAVVLQCAPIPVPLDYSDPGGEQIEIMISRASSPNPDKRRGVLLLNQGGPGGSGLAFADGLVSRGLPGSVVDSYDIIGFDTRGVGHSAPVHCGITADLGYQGNIQPYAVDDAAVDATAEVARAVARRCADNDTNGHLRHVSTPNVARDMDRIRIALGEEKISYFGVSYGTALGATYASLFPEQTDRIVLDSNVGDTHLDQDGLRRFALGAEQTFPGFARWAAERHDAYGLGSTPQQVRQTYDDLAARLGTNPVDGIDGALFRQVTFGGLYGPTLYGRTAATWQLLLSGQSTPTPTPPAEPVPLDNAFSSFIATTCNDVAWPRDVQTYKQAVAEDRERFPIFGAASANISPCAFWAHEPVEPPVQISTDGPANVLIVQNRFDPVTPLRGAEVLDEKFGDRSRLLIENSSGHGVYAGTGRSPCMLGATTAFLIGGPLPDGDLTCG
ncbi:alpha/beta fold hydrolase [Pseudonocardia sp. ICBG1122]|nr:alpha/beta fold hydrolase [Pseudonocardia pini]